MAMFKHKVRAGVLVSVAVLAMTVGCVTARASGYSLRKGLDTDGKARVAFGENNVWKPVSVAVVFEATAERTVRLERYVDDLGYVKAAVTGTGRHFVYVFEGAFWFSGTNALVVVVEPAQAGVVEVICE